MKKKRQKGRNDGTEKERERERERDCLKISIREWVLRTKKTNKSYGTVCDKQLTRIMGVKKLEWNEGTESIGKKKKRRIFDTINE